MNQNIQKAEHAIHTHACHYNNYHSVQHCLMNIEYKVNLNTELIRR